MTLHVATSTAAALTAGGRNYSVGPQARDVLVALPTSPHVGFLSIPLSLRARGVSRPALHETVVVLRG
jgi:hypothetical protein